ncbi:glycosyl hydrolase [Flammeovirga sp. SubArs3]|uniref:glycoside hydrolase family 26 protein n=1 Tax=Flammeovirga sp. SubArs3 TaxID=2995316 RepID=UPI00248B8AAB|nr:glycosyl hydrolase [Flammeovirga sp. SubArs3]
MKTSIKNYISRISIVCICILSVSCNPKPPQNISSTPASQLIDRLEALKDEGILFGHQDDLAYGVNWIGEDGRSDVKDVIGDYPALYGWDIGQIDSLKNLDNVPFNKIREYIISSHERQGVSTISWHTFSTEGRDSWDTSDKQTVKEILPNGKNHNDFNKKLDKVANFLLSLKDKNGHHIPVILRPWHEMNGEWFWWGMGNCTDDEYIALFRYTVDYLRTRKKVDNVIICFSPDRNFTNEKEYLQRYPGDDYVDILGIDNYYDFKEESRIQLAQQKLNVVATLAAKKKMLYAFSETGLETVRDYQWFSKTLLPVLEEANKIQPMSYVMVWRNANKKKEKKNHFFVPFKGHPSSEDFIEFSNNKLILTNKEIQVYN